jgi:hypothetical protein
MEGERADQAVAEQRQSMTEAVNQYRMRSK